MQRQNDLYLEIQSKDFYFNAAVPDDYEIVLTDGTVVSLYSKPKAENREMGLGRQEEQDDDDERIMATAPTACVCDDPVTDEEWLTLSQAAQILCTTYGAVWWQTKAGRLNAKNINGRLHVSIDELERFKPIYQIKRLSTPKWFEGSIKCATKM